MEKLKEAINRVFIVLKSKFKGTTEKVVRPEDRDEWVD